jgi:glycopeptide antibiotics resistance protein
LRRRNTKLLLWTLLIVALTVPWYGLQSTPRLRAIRWNPLLSLEGRINILDVILNVGLYLPFGYWMLRPEKTTAANVGKVVAAAFVLSLAAETSQMFSRRRFPSTTDLITNTTGAWIGAMVARARRLP